MSRTEWITDRKPTRDDADQIGGVLTLRGAQKFESVLDSEVWIPMPTYPRTMEELVKDLVKIWKQNVDGMEEPEATENAKEGALLMGKLVELVEEKQ